MKKIVLLIVLMSSTLLSVAQFTTTGFYRVRNVGTERYLYVVDNAVFISASGDYDVDAIALYRDPERKVYDPACVMFIEKIADGRYNIIAQGADVHKITDQYVNVYEKSTNQYQVYSEGLYMSDVDSTTNDRGQLGTDAKGNYRLWNVMPIDKADNCFGIKPTHSAGGKYYKPFYASFAYTFVGSNMHAYYISKVEKGAAIKEEVKGVIYPGTPVIIECRSYKPKDNTLGIQYFGDQPVSGNQLRGVYFNNPSRTRSTDACKEFDPKTMRILTVTEDGQLAFTNDGSSLQVYNGKRYLNANEAYLQVDSTAAAVLPVMTESEYIESSRIKTLTLSPLTMRISAGETATIKVKITPTTAVNKTLNWTSSDTSVATVADGIVTAVAPGNTTITATTTDGTNISATCKVTVKIVLVESLQLSSGTAVGKVGETIQLEPTIMPANASNKVLNWTSSNEKVATVANGKVTIVGVGSAEITATTTDGTKISAQCHITGQPISITGISLSTNSLTMNIGDSTLLAATVTPENATTKTLNWTSSNEQVAIVKDGVVTALSAGEATITAASTDGSGVSASCGVKVNVSYAQSLVLSPSDTIICEGETLTIIANVLPITTSNKVLNWTSSDETVATVTNGLVTAIKTGETTISATTTDGTNISATCKLRVQPVIAKSISLNKSIITAVAGTKHQLEVTILPQNTTNKNVLWTSTNEAVATVDSKGLVEVLSVGSAVITVSTTDGSNLSAECVITANPVLVSSVSLSSTTMSLHMGETAQLIVTVTPENATGKQVVWASKNEQVAIVSATGVITPVSVGETEVTVTAIDGSNASASCLVKVLPTLVSNISLSDSIITITKGESRQITASVLPTDATVQTLKWTSSNEQIAMVENGLIIGISAGEAIVTAEATDESGISASCKVVVNPILTQSITLDETSVTLHAGESIVLTPTILPADAEQTLIWTSANTRVAVVKDGKITAVAVGTTFVTAAANDGSGISAVCEVIVSPILVESIVLNPSSLLLYEGETALLEVTITPDDATQKGIIWSSSNPSVATITSEGMVSAIATGKAEIIARAQDGSKVQATCEVEVKLMSDLMQAINNHEFESIYDLMGRPVNNIRPGQIYIVNGRLIMVK